MKIVERFLNEGEIPPSRYVTYIDDKTGLKRVFDQETGELRVVYPPKGGNGPTMKGPKPPKNDLPKPKNGNSDPDDPDSSDGTDTDDTDNTNTADGGKEGKDSKDNGKNQNGKNQNGDNKSKNGDNETNDGNDTDGNGEDEGDSSSGNDTVLVPMDYEPNEEDIDITDGSIIYEDGVPYFQDGNGNKYKIEGEI